jgi:hypothetical protein
VYWRSGVKKSGNGPDGYFRGFPFGKGKFSGGDATEHDAFQLVFRG